MKILISIVVLMLAFMNVSQAVEVEKNDSLKSLGDVTWFQDQGNQAYAQTQSFNATDCTNTFGYVTFEVYSSDPLQDPTVYAYAMVEKVNCDGVVLEKIEADGIVTTSYTLDGQQNNASFTDTLDGQHTIGDADAIPTRVLVRLDLQAVPEVIPGLSRNNGQFQNECLRGSSTGSQKWRHARGTLAIVAGQTKLVKASSAFGQISKWTHNSVIEETGDACYSPG